MDENDQYKAFLQEYLGVIKNIIPLKNPPKKYPKTSRDRRILMRKRRKMTKRLSKTTTQEKPTKIKDELTKIELKLQKSYNHEREK